MANRRQKKKKNAAAARQAAAQYKGKNAPVKAAAPVKKPEPKPEPVPEAKPEPKPEAKPEVKQEIKSEVKQENKPALPAKPKTEKAKPAPKKKPVKVKRPKKNYGKIIAKKIFDFGVNKVAAIVLAVSVVVAAVCVIAWVTSSRFGVPDEAIIEYRGRTIPDTSTYIVTDDLVTQYSFADNMKRKGDVDDFRYYAATELVFPEKYSSANLNLVNVFDNNCVLIASIVNSSDTVIYRSLGLEPGRALSDIFISDLKYGRHDMKLVIAAYDPESYELIGVQYSDLTVQVGLEEETEDAEKQS